MLHCRGVTIEYQRQRAKEMRAYFQERKLEQEIVQTSCVGQHKAVVVRVQVSDCDWDMILGGGRGRN
jgi:hypothetical protein